MNRRLELTVRFALCWVLLGASLPAVSGAESGTGSAGMVGASQVDAAEAGLAMLEAGGNAVDAAVATAFALAVTQPFSAGLGGGVFLVGRTDAGEYFALDARETAPAAADRDMYVREGVDPRASLAGGLAVATHGFCLL